MMRSSIQPLAHLVDAAAEKWLAVENAPFQEQQAAREEILGGFRIGDLAELTFHGLRYQLTIIRDIAVNNRNDFSIEVHEIVNEE